jgi:hypothetical protein
MPQLVRISEEALRGRKVMCAKSRLSMLSCWAIAVFLLISAPDGWAATTDVGLVTGLSGEVTYWHPEEKHPPTRAQAFLKIRDGDHFQLHAGSQVQLTYFASCRQETWKGPVTLEVGEQESRAMGKEPPPSPLEVKVLMAKVAKRMKGIPTVVSRSEVQATKDSKTDRQFWVGQKPWRGEYSGTEQVQKLARLKPPPPRSRSLSEQDKKTVAEAQKVYQDLKNQAKADDLTPDIYLLSVYAVYGQYGEMDQLLSLMLYNREDPNLRKLKAWARAQASRKP